MFGEKEKTFVPWNELMEYAKEPYLKRARYLIDHSYTFSIDEETLASRMYFKENANDKIDNGDKNEIL